MSSRSGRGFTLLEVLIAMLIFSFGLLGLAALQTYSVKANQSANFRSQATALAATLMDNVRANRVRIGDYYSNSYAAVDCDTAPSGADAPALDIAMWRQQIACELPQGEGAIAPIPPIPPATAITEIAVCIRWSDSRLQQGSAAGTNCAGDAAAFGAGSAAGGTGAGIDGDSSVFVVATRL